VESRGTGWWRLEGGGWRVKAAGCKDLGFEVLFTSNFGLAVCRVYTTDFTMSGAQWKT
jgi:hypothetical protein